MIQQKGNVADLHRHSIAALASYKNLCINIKEVQTLAKTRINKKKTE